MIIPFHHSFLGKFYPVFSPYILCLTVISILFIMFCFKLTLALISPLNILSSWFWHLVLKIKNYWLLYSFLHPSPASGLVNFSYLFLSVLFFVILSFPYTGWRKKNACFWIYLRFLSLGLPEIKSLLSKTSYSRRSESFHSRRNCNCTTRNVSKCDAELWEEAADVCTARRRPSFRYNFP